MALILDGSTGIEFPEGAPLGANSGGTGLEVSGNTGNVLVSNGTSWTSSLPSVNASSQITGTLPAANGGTGITSPGTSGNVLTSNGSSWTSSVPTVDGTNAVGFRTIPQNSQSAAYTLVLTDSGKHILHPSADTTARTFTIPANGSVAYPIGTAITFINQNGAGVVTIAITTDTMRLSPAGTTGSRTLAANGSATAIKITSTEWLISGSGLT